MNVFRKLYKVFSNVLFVFVILSFVLITAITMLSSLNMKQDRLLFGTFGFGRVVTGSMEPDIPTGSFILVQQRDPSALKVGDVILFRSKDPTVPDQMNVSHQIVRIEPDQNGKTAFYTKGTANPSEDNYPTYAEDIVGVVTYHSKLIGSLIGLAQSSYIYPILILLLLVSMAQSIVDIVKQLIALSKESKT